MNGEEIKVAEETIEKYGYHNLISNIKELERDKFLI